MLKQEIHDCTHLEEKKISTIAVKFTYYVKFLEIDYFEETIELRVKFSVYIISIFLYTDSANIQK